MYIVLESRHWFSIPPTSYSEQTTYENSLEASNTTVLSFAGKDLILTVTIMGGDWLDRMIVNTFYITSYLLLLILQQLHSSVHLFFSVRLCYTRQRCWFPLWDRPLDSCSLLFVIYLRRPSWRTAAVEPHKCNWQLKAEEVDASSAGHWVLPALCPGFVQECFGQSEPGVT